MRPRFADDLFRDFWMWPMTSYGFKVDIKEDRDHYLLQAELPGMDKSNITLELDGDYLTIGVRSDETVSQEEENRYIRRERRMMSCERQFYVGDVSPEDIQARYRNGMLEVKIPKTDQQGSGRRIIEIE
jgi:HSP20 family protein